MTIDAERVLDVLRAADGRVEVDGIIERIGPPRISAARVLAAKPRMKRAKGCS